MIKPIYKWLALGATRRTIAIFAGASILFVLALNLAKLAERLAGLFGYSGTQRMFKLDLTFGYTPQQAYAIFENYGEKGRKAEIYVTLLLDFIYPAFYSLTLAFGLTAALKKLVSNPFKWVSLVPLAAGGADYLENVGKMIMLWNYPTKLILLAKVTGIFTILKYLLLIASTVTLLVTLLILGLRRLSLPRKLQNQLLRVYAPFTIGIFLNISGRRGFKRK